MPGVPPEYRTAVEKALVKRLHLVPSWCHILTFGYNATPPEDMDECLAAVSVNFEYRQAAIEVYPAFLEEPTANRERAIAHEIIHIALQPMVDLTRSIIERATADDALRLYFNDEVTARLEGSVVDLTRAVCRAKP